jgi:hypothetical protein
MGRKKIETEQKKGKLSITISRLNYTRFEDFGITNKSKLIEWLLEQHFALIDNKPAK